MSLSLVVATVMAAAPDRSAKAFCPTNGWKCALGAVGQTHKDITTAAIQDLDREFFSTARITTGMKTAIQNIADGNASVDANEPGISSSHFDGESFEAGHQRLVDLLNKVVAAMGDPADVSTARSLLGQALHTEQDFYSHSNWVELGHSRANTSTWREDESLGPVSVSTEATCTGTCLFEICFACQSNLSTSALTSGYYPGQNHDKPNPGKCSHGGLISLSHGGEWQGINKDTLVCDVSPHALLHDDAAAAAVDGTKELIRDLKERLTPRQLKLLLGANSTLAISIDTTGSMGSVIAGVRDQAIQIVNARLGTDEEPTRYILSPFNDPSVGPLTITDDAEVFKAAISGLGASGGGDCPELSMAGALAALNAADENVDLFTFTDATAKDSALSSSIRAVAVEKNAKIFPILFGSCSPIDPAYIQLANDTGGQLFFLSRPEAGQVARLADLTVRSNAVDILSVADPGSGASNTYDVPLDPSLTEAVFSVSGSTAVTIRRPDGTTVGVTDLGITFVPLSSGAIYSIATPQPGTWSVEIGGVASYSLNVTGNASLSFDSFRFVELGGADPHQGFFPLNREPVLGESTIAAASLSGGFATASFSFVDKQGSLLQGPLAFQRDEMKDDFFGTVSLPPQSFLVYATGQDTGGFFYQRVIPLARQPETVMVTPPPVQHLQPGVATTYSFVVQNLGASDTFVVTALDDRGFVATGATSTLPLATGATATVTVTLVAPTGTRDGTVDKLTVTARSTGASSVMNFASVTSSVVDNRPPDCSTGAVSPATLWPPNHGMITVAIHGVTDPDGDPVSINVDQVTSDENPNAKGDGNTCPDASMAGTNAVSLRAERSGSGNGRVYRISYTATDGHGGTCHASTTVCVPHDAGQACQEDATSFNALVCK